MMQILADDTINFKEEMYEAIGIVTEVLGPWDGVLVLKNSKAATYLGTCQQASFDENVFTISISSLIVV